MKRADQRGLALISVLLVTSLALLVVGGLLRSHHLMLNGISQQVHQLHLRQAALAAEGRALQWLQGAGFQANDPLHLAQDWAVKPQDFQLPDTEVRLGIEDLGGRFNLARLTAPDDVDEVHRQRWSNLLSALNIKPFDPAVLKNVVLTDPGQLQRIPDLRKDDLHRLLPWVAVLPKSAALNVNTASAHTLASLEGMTLNSAKALVAARPTEGYADAMSFTRAPGVDGLGISTHGLGVRSRWFRISAQVRLGDLRLLLVTDVERVANTQRLRILQRRLQSPHDGGVL